MAIDVGIDHLIGHIATGRTEKSPAPKMPTPLAFANLWKLLLNLPRTTPLSHLHKVTDRNRRWNLCKNRDVIRRQNTLDNPNAHCFCHWRDNRANTPPHVALPNPVSIFRNPYHVITVVKNRVATCAVLGPGGQLVNQACVLTL